MVDETVPKKWARCEDLPPQHRESYDSLLNFLTRSFGNPEFSLGRVYHGAEQCHLRPSPDQKFCAGHVGNQKCFRKHGILRDTLDADDQHCGVMVELCANL